MDKLNYKKMWRNAEDANIKLIKKIAEMKDALSGRTVSCENCNKLAEKLEVAKGALEFLASPDLLKSRELEDVFDRIQLAKQALEKLEG